MEKALNFIRENYKKLIIAGVVLTLIIWRVTSNGENSGVVVYEVKSGDIVSEVAVTGRVKPVSEVSMAFEKTGRIASSRKVVGDKVYRGEVIASLDLTSPLAKLNQERAVLDQLIRGSRPEEIAVKEAEVSKAKEDLQKIYDGAFDVLNDAYVKSEDAVRVKTSAMFTGTPTTGYQLSFNGCDAQTEENTRTSYSKSEVVLNKWREELSNFPMSRENEKRELALRNGLDNLNVFIRLLRDLGALLNQQCLLENTSLDTYRDNVSTANTSIASALSGVSDQLGSLNTYKAALRKAESDLALLKAGSDPEEIRVQESKVADAQSVVATFQIISPINGIITKQDAKVGEIAYANTELVSVISDTAYEIEINVPELDITSIKKGNPAKITFDAYGENIAFPGIVSSVDPAETIVDNVPTYKVKVSFVEVDERVKSGLTANVYIETESKTGILTIPAKAIKSVSGKKVVSLEQEDGSTIDREVVLGIRGNNGEVEVVSGLSLGDKIIISNASVQK